MTTATEPTSAIVLTFRPRPGATASGRTAGAVVLPFASRRMSATMPVIDIDGWYHQAAIEQPAAS